MVNGFEEEVKALEEYGHDCCARIDDRIHECCKRIREAHEQELNNTRYAYEISMSLMKEQTLSDLYGIRKEGDGGVDAGGRVETGGGRSDAAADGHMAGSAGSQVSEGVAPITVELRDAMERYCNFKDENIVKLAEGDFDRLCDAIDAVHAQLERDYKVACEVNERQDEQYADMVHKLNRAYEKNRNQRKQLTEVQEAIHRRNEGELKARWQKELDRLERENEELRRQLESLLPPTVEDVLREFGKAWVEWEDGSPHDPIAKFAAKLLLAGSDAE